MEQFSDKQSISGMKTFKIYKDENSYMYTFKNVNDGYLGIQ